MQVVEVDIEFAKGNEIEGIVAGKNGHLFVGFKVSFSSF